MCNEGARNCEEDCHPCSCCEPLWLCRTLAKKGTPWGEENRRYIIGLALFTTVVATILSIVVICAISTNEGTVKNVAWSHGSWENIGNTTSGDIYIGLSNVVVCVDDDCDTTSWDDQECNLNLNGDNACQDCKDASTASYILAITALITQVPTVQNDFARLNPDTDRNIHKGLAVVQGAMNFFSNIGTVTAFAAACYTNLNEGEVNYELGPGFMCLLMVLWIKPLNVFLHYLVPVPLDRRPGGAKLIESKGANYDATELSLSK